MNEYKTFTLKITLYITKHATFVLFNEIEHLRACASPWGQASVDSDH